MATPLPPRSPWRSIGLTLLVLVELVTVVLVLLLVHRGLTATAPPSTGLMGNDLVVEGLTALSLAAVYGTLTYLVFTDRLG